MKRLVFKKWVEICLEIMLFAGLFMVAAFEYETFLPYLIGLVAILTPAILLGLYGRK